MKSIFSRHTLADEVQGSVSRLERERIQMVLLMIEHDARRVGIENKLTFLRSWLRPAEQTLLAQQTPPNEKSE